MDLESGYVPHSQNPGGHPFRIEGLQIAHTFTGAYEFDGLPTHRANRQRGASTCIAVQFGEYGARNADFCVKPKPFAVS